MEPTRDQQILSRVFQKAWEDEGYKEELLEHPVVAVERIAGQAISLRGRKLRVSDQTDPAKIYINIPLKPDAMDDAELTEDQLDHVAGGGELDPGNLFPNPRGNG